MSHDYYFERVKLEREMDPDLEVIRGHIESAYCRDNDPTLEKEDREKLFRACLSLSRRLKILESLADTAARQALRTWRW